MSLPPFFFAVVSSSLRLADDQSKSVPLDHVVHLPFCFLVSLTMAVFPPTVLNKHLGRKNLRNFLKSQVRKGEKSSVRQLLELIQDQGIDLLARHEPRIREGLDGKSINETVQ